jgi:hypothetical protein
MTNSQAPRGDDEPVELTAEEIQVIYQHLRMLRHAVNNHVAVIMAMAELSQRHPGQGEKFCQMCLEKGPQIVNALRRFSDSMEAALHIERNNHATN